MQGDERKEPCFPLPCSCSETSGAKRNWPHWPETAEQTPHCSFYKHNRAAHLQNLQGKYTVSSLLWLPSPILRYLQVMHCCCHLCSQSQQAFLSHLLWQVGALPWPGFNTASQETEICDWGAFGNVNIFTCVCVADADLLCLPATQHLMQVPLNGGSHRTLTCILAKNTTAEKN